MILGDSVGVLGLDLTKDRECRGLPRENFDDSWFHALLYFVLDLNSSCMYVGIGFCTSASYIRRIVF